MHIKKTATIIGGGIAGLWSARELARLGIDSAILETALVLGGHAARLCCKATDKCQRCGACILEDTIQNIKQSPLITQFVSTNVTELAFRDNMFQIAASRPSDPEPLAIETSAVVVATGFKPFDAALKQRFGYGRIPGVITGMELESRIRDNAWNGDQIRKVAFIQCVGSRDAKHGKNYCSRVCCGYAMRLAQLLNHRIADVEPAVFYMDLQTYDRDFERRVKEAQEHLRLMRSIPSEIRSGEDARPELIYQGTDETRISETFDLAVLSVGMSPGENNQELSSLFGIPCNRDGFLGPEGEGVLTGREGIFIAGSAQGPRSIAESISHAAKTAAEVVKHLRCVGERQ
jgi:heterodisulfide reductase subunit A2